MRPSLSSSSSAQPERKSAHKNLFRSFFILLLLCAFAPPCYAAQASSQRRASVAVLDFGGTETGLRAAAQVARSLAGASSLQLSDRDEARAAARGLGYAGSLNMTLVEARDLGASLGTDFFLTGDAQTLRRSPSTGPVYYEAYASVFLVSSRTGRLVMWERITERAASTDEALALLLKELARVELRERYMVAVRRAFEDESRMRALAVGRSAPLIEEAPDDAGATEAKGLRLPAPYRRLRPAYTAEASRAEAEATVDVEVDIDADGKVSRVEVVRWAGFGLDEGVVQTVRQMHFRPAMRDGVAIPMRVLLRYNFRKPK